MSLSCDYDYDPEPGDVVWYFPESITQLERRRAAKCCSCGAKISPGELAAEWRRAKIPDADIEISIYGEDGEIPRASWFQCAPCGNLCLFLRGFHYSFNPTDDMRELAAQHAETQMRGKAVGCL